MFEIHFDKQIKRLRFSKNYIKKWKLFVKIIFLEGGCYDVDLALSGNDFNFPISDAKFF